MLASGFRRAAGTMPPAGLEALLGASDQDPGAGGRRPERTSAAASTRAGAASARGARDAGGEDEQMEDDEEEEEEEASDVGVDDSDSACLGSSDASNGTRGTRENRA